MRKIITGVFAIVLVAGMGTFAWKASAADEPAAQADDKGMAESAAPAEGAETALRAALDTPAGELKNPYDPSNEEIVAMGLKKFRSACAPCHGGTGGGGMGPPLTNEVWNYDSKDDTLFRLITLGSDCKNFEYCVETVGLKGVKREMMSGAMPGQGQLQKDAPEGKSPSLVTPDDVWKVITWIRSVNPGSLKNAQ